MVRKELTHNSHKRHNSNDYSTQVGVDGKAVDDSALMIINGSFGSPIADFGFLAFM